MLKLDKVFWDTSIGADVDGTDVDGADVDGEDFDGVSNDV